MNTSFESKQNKRKTVIWALLFLVIAAASIYAVKQVSREFSFRNLMRLIRQASPLPVILAFCAALCYILFQAMSIRTLLKSFGHERSVLKCIQYTAADHYFSAITPSATGGQPACGFVMVSDGVPASCMTICLVANWASYTLSILIIGILTLIIAPQVFNYFSTAAKILICIGALMLLILGLLGLLASFWHNAIDAVGRFVIRAGKKLRIIKNKSAEASIIQWVTDYKGYSQIFREHVPAMLKSLFFNLVQRFSYLSITMFMYIAVNINRPIPPSFVIYTGFSLLGAQALISIGSTFIPIPGAMGYTDLMMLNAFGAVMRESDAASLALMARSVAFYFVVVLCFIITITTFITLRKKQGR